LIPAQPPEGLLVYQLASPSTGTSPAGFYYWDISSSTWKTFSGGGADSDWTIDNNDIYNTNSGNVGVGENFDATKLPSAKLHLKGTTDLSSDSYVFRLVDRTQKNGYVLVSDAFGNGTWQDSGSLRYGGKQASDSKNKLDNDFKQKTNATILKQHTALKDLELEYLKLKKMANKLIIENK
jgi:hypothetical protein